MPLAWTEDAAAVDAAALAALEAAAVVVAAVAADAAVGVVAAAEARRKQWAQTKHSNSESDGGQN